MTSALLEAVKTLDIEHFQSAVWDIETSVVGTDGWQAAKLIVSGTVKPGFHHRGDLFGSYTIAAVAHEANGAIDELRLHGLPGTGGLPPVTAQRQEASRDRALAVTNFLASYGSADAHGMVRSCHVDATYRGPWPGPGFRAKRHTRGYVATDGKPIWRGLFDAFGDFEVVLHRLITSPGRAVAAEVSMSGRQVRPWLQINDHGHSFTTTGVLFFELGDDGRITSVDETLDFDLLESQLLSVVGV